MPNPIQSVQSAIGLTVFLAMNTLYKNRDEKGFISFVNELKGVTADGDGWKIEPTGHVYVQPGEFKALGLMDKLDDVLGAVGVDGKRKYPWYQTIADRRKLNLEEIPVFPKGMKPKEQLFNPGYPKLEEDFKAGHGKYGENDCIEVGIFEIKEDKNGQKALYFKHITRRAEENKANAFIGGQMFRREDLHKQRINEVLEEFFSGCLFREGAETLSDAESVDPRSRSDILNRALATLSKKSELQVLNTASMMEKINAIVENKENLSFATQLQQLKECSLLIAPPYTEQDFNHAICLLKCELYKEFFPNEWQGFYTFMTQKFDTLPVVQLNGAAPSNTSLAFISSTISMTLLTKETFETSKKAWKLEEVAGDDASGVYTTLVEELFESDEKMISFHPAYLLQAIEHFCLQNPTIFEDKSIAQQIEKIKAKVTERVLTALARDYGIGFNKAFEPVEALKKEHGHYMGLVSQCEPMKEVATQASKLIQEDPLVLKKAQELLQGLQTQARTSVSAAALSSSFSFTGATANAVAQGATTQDATVVRMDLVN